MIRFSVTIERWCSNRLPEEALHHADAVVMGEAEGILHRVLEDFERNRMRGIYKNERLPDLSGLPRPRFDLLHPKHRRFIHSVQATRGCPHDCEFCSVTPFFGHRYRLRPVKEVLADLEASFERSSSKAVFFVDDNIVGRTDYAKELFRVLIPHPGPSLVGCSVPREPTGSRPLASIFPFALVGYDRSKNAGRALKED